MTSEREVGLSRSPGLLSLRAAGENRPKPLGPDTSLEVGTLGLLRLCMLNRPTRHRGVIGYGIRGIEACLVATVT